MAGAERTLSIIKPDAVASGATGEILSRIEAAGLAIIAMKRLRLGEEIARGFYAVHKDRPFFEDLVRFMTSGPVVISVLEGEDAIARWRGLQASLSSSLERFSWTNRCRTWTST